MTQQTACIVPYRLNRGACFGRHALQRRATSGAALPDVHRQDGQRCRLWAKQARGHPRLSGRGRSVVPESGGSCPAERQGLACACAGAWLPARCPPAGAIGWPSPPGGPRSSGPHAKPQRASGPARVCPSVARAVGQSRGAVPGHRCRRQQKRLFTWLLPGVSQQAEKSPADGVGTSQATHLNTAGRLLFCLIMAAVTS
jgi:hypothetical protein